VGHAEVSLYAASDVTALVVAQDYHRVLPYLRQSPAHRRVVRTQAVAGELVEVIRQGVTVGTEVGAVGVAGDLYPLVGGQV
jgi:hypothetical protein